MQRSGESSFRMGCWYAISVKPILLKVRDAGRVIAFCCGPLECTGGAQKPDRFLSLMQTAVWMTPSDAKQLVDIDPSDSTVRFGYVGCMGLTHATECFKWLYEKYAIHPVTWPARETIPVPCGVMSADGMWTTVSREVTPTNLVILAQNQWSLDTLVATHADTLPFPAGIPTCVKVAEPHVTVVPEPAGRTVMRPLPNTPQPPSS